MARLFFAPLFLVIAVAPAGAADPIRFARMPDISPDGRLLTFSYLGDIWVVEAIGGVARPVTLHEAHDIYPFFSPDGRSIAFSSNRHGSYDVFVVPTHGGKPVRLTFDSAADYATGWSPDGTQVLFSSHRTVDFPPRSALFRVPAGGGDEARLPFVDAKDICYSSDGSLAAYVRGPGAWYRKGYRGSSNDDLWLANADGTNHRRVTTFNGQDTSPMISPDGRRLYYVSEQHGTPANIVCVDLTSGPAAAPTGAVRQVTRHTEDGVRRARLSRNGEWIVYECGTDLFVVATKDGANRRVAIDITVDDKTNPERIVTYTNSATEYAVSPDDKLIAFVVQGELFLMPQSGGKTVRLTNHGSCDHAPSWAPDGKKLIFLSDRNGRDNVFQLEPDDPEGTEFATAQRFKVKPLTNATDSIAGASFSPDGKRIAFLQAGKLHSMNPDGTDVKVIVGETQVIDYDWSPDSKSLVLARLDGSFGTELYIVPATGGSPKNITRYATSNYDVSWSASGMKVAFVSERPGPGGMMARPYVLSLQKPAAANAPASTEIDWDDIHVRAQLVSPLNAWSVSISNDGSRVAFRSGDDLWVANSDGQAPQRLGPGVKPQEIRWSKKSSGLIYFRDGTGQIRLARAGNLFGAGGDPQVLRFSARMTIRREEEFAEMFEQSWRSLADAFYDRQHHGVDWTKTRAKYQPAVRHVTHKEDLYALISLMLGELNASHLGIQGAGPTPEEFTAEIGLLLDDQYPGPGKKIAEVVKHGPADRRGLNLKTGDIITAIDREPVTGQASWSKLLNGKVGETIRLDVQSDLKDPKTKRRVDVQSINRQQMANLMYERWCNRNSRRVAELSGNNIGYIHIPSMDQPGLDRFVRALYSDCFDKDAIVLDVRYNGGGYTHDQVLNYLTGKEHTIFRQRDGGEGLVLRASDRKWTRPLALLINNQSYSDAEIFPSAFRAHGLGKIVGQATGGFVIGTGGTTLIDGSSFRLPRIGVFSARGVNMEKEGVSPDVPVEPTPEEMAQGIDRQLEKAVELVKVDVAAWKKARTSTTVTGGGGSKPVTSQKP